ncbi:DUF1294 domain-containing protein [Flavobacterium amnicola]|uniref:DUF1294 domain-containing protein n=1 Tax=Flavobacterium amnicola TaxID=2506422 RepID=A0A4Q1K6B7_9FLAO|nr:DUF1294 domain-containing protein [Flavobacterium amnicola]RXR20955.1 DUF1294 domain-containing protein [Flavobacterium amnicola]
MILFFLLLINAITFGVFGYDKYLAKTNQYRIPENTLFLLTIIGGSLGAIAGMVLFSHKISKPRFYIPIIMIILFQVVAVYYFRAEGF